MAKKKLNEITSDDDLALFMAEVKKEYGNGILTDASRIMDSNKTIIPWSPNLDAALKGGVPEGCFISIAGKPKCGKTTSCLTLAAQCQKPEYGSRRVFYLNIEHRLKKKNLAGIEGLDTSPDRFHIVESTKDRILSAQDFLKLGVNILKRFPRCLLIIDSVSCLVDQTILTDGMGTQTYGSGAKLFSQFCDLVQAVVPINNSIVCGIAHLISKMNGNGGLVEKAAHRLMFQADIKMKTTWVENWPPKGELIGQVIHWDIEESALGQRGKCDNYLRFGMGLDRTYEMMERAKDVGLISSSGAWYTLSFMQNHLDLLGVSEWNSEVEKSVRYQGGEAMYAAVRSNPSWLKALEDEVRAANGI